MSGLRWAVLAAIVQLRREQAPLYVKDVAERASTMLPAMRLTPRKVGDVVRNELHLSTKRSHNLGRNYAVIWDEAVILAWVDVGIRVWTGEICEAEAVLKEEA